MPDNSDLSFAQHQSNLDDFVVECNDDLRRRGIHACEAYVHANWQGQAMLTMHTMTTGRTPNGPLMIQSNQLIELPWLFKDGGLAKDLVSKALQAATHATAEVASKAKVFRVTVQKHSETISRRIQAATEIPKVNGRQLIVTP